MKSIIALTLLILTAVSSPCFSSEMNTGREWYIWTKDKTQIYVHEIGRKDKRNDPVVVLHGGFGAEHSYVIPALESLRKNHTFILYDQRGSLRSPADPKGITLENFVSDLDQLRTELKIDKLTLLAHSAGTTLAYAYLEKHPEHVKNLILVGPAFPFAPGAAPDHDLLKELNLPSYDSAYISALQKHYKDKVAKNEKAALEQIKLEGLDHEPISGLERTLKLQIRYASYNIYNVSRWRDVRGGQAFFEPSVFENLVNNSGGYDSWLKKWSGFFPALKAFKGKITFIVGAHDDIDPGCQFWPPLAKRLPKAKLVVIQEAGHMIWIDQPLLFSKYVQAALK